MLIRFSFENFKSFASKGELSFVATRGGEHRDHLLTPEGLDAQLLPIVGIYGANASGKSNALDALVAMARMVRRVPDPEGAPAPIYYRPFKLRDDTIAAPTTFDCEFVLNNMRLRYGFAYTATRIEREWLHAWPQGNRQIWFERNAAAETDGWYFGPSWRQQRYRAATETLESDLFLSGVAQRKHPEALAIRSMFTRWIQANFPIGARGIYPKSPLFEEANAPFVLEILRGADLGITAFRVLNMRKRLMEELQHADGPRHLEDLASAIDKIGDPLTLQLGHEGEQGRTFWLEPEEESDGTGMLISHLHHILTALKDGRLLILDEFDQAIHPNLAPLLLQFFTDRQRNPRGAQLAFAAHQTALMSHLRRDEVYVTEKGLAGDSRLASIAEFRALKREDIEHFYRAGRFGGVPRVGGLAATLRREARTPEPVGP